jgi:adenine/guanine phosphoribosyltransferase-like PRPP-binding protein
VITFSIHGLVEYYGSWDHESAHWTLSREHALAEDLSTIEAQLLQTHEATPELKAQMKAVETEVRAAYQDDMDRVAARPTRQLPPGTPVSYAMLRGLSVLRQRERDEQ